ncbi:zinc-dependent alcohol dehydrogenase [Pseudomonas oryzihabitans]|uniref:zinc-dependent alcohol dehydrogenase n=1 Tax=Pseudomonas oryzihabitans TaxID=47885 RepID=UPI00289BE348|nr:zinc-dependent alcohol dehydrogenase [Pseudomonas oryzihabitans]
MSQTMKAAVLHAAGEPLRIEQVAIPQPGPGQVLIRVVACGVCHSDLHAVDGDWSALPRLPLIPGHEVTGYVAALGPGVSEPAIGTPVGMPWMYSACGTCEFCESGMETICEHRESTGYSQQGGYAEYMVAPAAFVASIPDGTDLYALAPILCAGVTTYRGLKRSRAQPGQWVAVLGVGGLGHVAVQYALAMGLRVAAIDVGADKLELAGHYGAECLIDALNDPVAALKQHIPGGVHAALVTATANAAFEQSVKMLRPGGTAVFIGLPGGDADTVRASISAISGWELSITGSNIGTRQDLNEAVAFAARGQVKAQISLASLDDINLIFERMRKGQLVGRTVLKIS